MFILYFLTFTLLYLMIGIYISRKKEGVKKRIKRFILDTDRIRSRSQGNLEDEGEVDWLKRMIVRFSTIFHPKVQKKEKLQQNLDAAGIPLKPEEWMVVRGIIVAMVVILSILFQFHFFISFLLSVFVWFLLNAFLNIRRDQRLRKTVHQLPHTLDTMSTAMKSGFSFIQAMQLIAKEVPDPIGSEFQKAIREINLGENMETAFQNMLNRIPNRDLEMVVTAVLIQRQTGGNLIKILETLRETVVERIRVKEEIHSLTAQGKLSAWIVTLLPIALAILLTLMNPQYFLPILSHPFGIAILIGGITLELIGWILIQKIIKIEV
ncbi:type II secretion system F family protein [Bacillus massilinigeriensis]|uniref:type II secretion system F family protein n=1 Tax=Bacillus massilionigeriensis TaxID=1805475 RepID=UPI00096B268A|nr:type II secretion system F family protein [Bacillus massilionigeriensis]